MSFLSRLLGFNEERKLIDAGPLTWSELLGGATAAKSGIPVTELTALRTSVVWACCRVICEDIGKLPVRLMQEIGREKRVAKEHPLHDVLSRRPNEWQTPMDYRAHMMIHALLAHGGYSLINRASDGSILELIPIQPGRILPRQDKQWRVTYEIRDAVGVVGVFDRSVIHSIHGPSWDGVTGLELIRYGAEAIGLAAALEESHARLHGQGARPGGTITTSATLNKEQIERIKGQFASSYGGVANSFKTLLLDNGLKFEPWTMTGVDSQHLQTRKFQIEEVCRFFRIFPSMVGYSDKTSTYASAESFLGAHVVHTLSPWVTRWEQAAERDLLSPDDRRKGFFVKFVMEGLLRGDHKTRAAFYESAVTRAGWMTRNEVRQLEDLNPIDGLDDILQPANTGAPGGEPTDSNDVPPKDDPLPDAIPGSDAEDGSDE